MNAAELWNRNRDLAQACLDHPFLQGIASGTLPRACFASYVAQDAWFLEAFIRAYAIGLSKSPDREGLYAFKHLIDGALEELRLHADYARRWGIHLQPEPAPETLAYTDFLLRTASLEPVGTMVAAMTPCMRLYAWLGQQLEPVVHPESPYLEWVGTYSSEAFESLAKRLEELLDRYIGDRIQAAAAYRRAMELEYRFFDAAWRRENPEAEG